MTTARDRLIAYAASTRTIAADDLDPLIDAVVAEALTTGDPLALPEPTLEALIDVGNKALADYYHERACSCSTWPEACHSKLKAVLWETDAFAIGLPAILAAWQEMQNAGVQAETPACGERLGDAVCVLAEPTHGRHVTAEGDYWFEAADCAQNGCEHSDCQESALECGATATDGTECCFIAQHRKFGKPHSFEPTPSA